MATGGHYGCPKITFDRMSGHFRLIWNFFVELFDGHFGCPKFTFNLISGHFRLIRIFFGGHFGCPKITFDRIYGHFRSIGHFGCPNFHFDHILDISDRYKTLYIFLKFDKMVAGGHFGFMKITFDRISGHFRSIRNFFFKFLTKWF